jgi:oligoribonuclease NrnB/cAMP/cGMP phosphodiesterase (DHH superfamily)
LAAGFDGDLAKLLEGVGGGGHRKAAAAAVRMDRLHAVPDRELGAAATVRLWPNHRWVRARVIQARLTQERVRERERERES